MSERIISWTMSPAFALTRSAYPSIMWPAYGLVKPRFQEKSPASWFSPAIGFT